MSRWYEEDFSVNTVEEFFKQCQEFTKQAIEKSGIKGLKHTSFNFFEPPSQHVFTPRGIVVSASKTVSIWDSLFAIASRAYNVNFIISNRKPRKGDGELLEQMPATILIPSTVTNVIHHASYLSKYTWGIEIRNVGKLRPVSGRDKPDPVYKGEETDKFFTSRRQPSKYYWWNDLWREEFDGRSVPYGKYFFEHPMNRQVEALLVLIRILSKYTPIRRELILPLDCIIGGEPHLPSIDWHAVRETFFGTEKTQEYSRNKLLNNIEVDKSDWNRKEQRDEYFLRELSIYHSNRVGFDNGQVDFIFDDKKLLTGSIKNLVEPIRELGYDPFDMELACRMMTLAHGGRADRDLLYTNIVNKLVAKRRGSENIPTYH